MSTTDAATTTTLAADSTITTAQKLKKEYDEFRELFSDVLYPETTDSKAKTQAQPAPAFVEVSEMMERILLLCKPFFPSLVQPKFVVTDCGTTEQMSMFYCVPTAMEIPQTLLFQQGAAQKMTERQQKFWHRMASFVDSEWYVVPVLCLLLRHRGHRVNCCAVQSKVLETLPVLRMQTGTYTKNGKERANTRDVLMSAFVEKSTGTRSSLSVSFNVGGSQTRAPDLSSVYACEGDEDEWERLSKGSRYAFVPTTMKKTHNNVDSNLQLFLLYKNLQSQSPGIAQRFMDTVHQLQTK